MRKQNQFSENHQYGLFTLFAFLTLTLTSCALQTYYKANYEGGTTLYVLLF